MKNTIKIKLSIIFCFLFFISYSQQISGVITNEYGVPINKALIQVYDKDTIQLHTFKFSNFNGTYAIKINRIEDYLLKISALNYKTIYKKILKNKKVHNFTLLSHETILDEVVIVAHKKIAKLKGDSIVYNLKTIRDSTELNLGDLIKKLPGLELTKDGKVKFQGIPIDNILIDGNEFFGKRHQIATQNISADMVSGIDLLLKSQDNINSKEFEEDSKIALNITLNSLSKNKIIGNIEANGGIVNKYLFHSNIFKFFKNGNLTLISNYNNIGETSLSVSDYIDIIGGLSSSKTSGITNINDLIPSYIYSEEKLKEKTNLFSALSFSYKKNKLKINTSVFFNHFNQLNERGIEKTFLNETTQQINELFKAQNKNFIVNSIFELDYKLNRKSNINYYSNFSHNKGNTTENVFSNINYITLKKNNSNLIINNLKYDYKINNKYLFKTILSFKNNTINTKLNINTSLPTIFSFNTNKVNQKFNFNSNELYIKSSILHKNRKNKYKFSISLINTNQKLNTEIDNFNLNNNINRKITNLKTSLDLTQYFTNNFSLINRFSLNNYNFNSQIKTNKLIVENNISLNYKLNNVNNISFGYSNRNSIPNLNQMLVNQYLVDYQNVNSAPNINSGKFINTNTLTLNFNNFNQKYEQFLTLNLSYSFSKEYISTSSIFTNNYNSFNYIFTENYKNLRSLIIFDRKFRKIPIILKSSFSLNYTQSENKIENKLNKSDFFNYGLNFKLLSHLKNSKIQFQLSYLFKNSTIEQSISNSSMNLFTNDIGLDFIFKIKSIRINSEFHYLTQKNETNINNNLIINPEIMFQSENKKWIYSIKSNNLLNLNKYNYLNQNYSNYYIENSSQSVLTGFLIFGLKYHF
ncbi:MAG TPA: hypothetical protein EYG85_13065 [Crocinitomix sp.]|nr:hypothetical protein [Crocinitomix sp.]